MAFSLKKLVKGVFDGGNPLTVQQPQPQQQRAAPPRPASTAPRPNPIQVQRVQKPMFNTNPLPTPTPKPLTVGVAPQQNLQVGKATIAPSQTARTNVAEVKMPDMRSTLSKLPGGNTVQGIGLGAARSAVGTVQAASGLYDLVTPGKGTNSYSNLMKSTAENLDFQAKDRGANKFAYKGAQLVGDLASFAAGGQVAKGATKAIPALGKVSPFINSNVKTATAGLNGRGFGGRVVAGGIRGALNPNIQVPNAVFGGMQLGKMASQGEDIGVGNTALNIAPGVALPFAGSLAKEAAAPAVRGAVNAARNANLIAPSRLGSDEVSALNSFAQQARSGAIMDEGIYQQGVAAAQKAGIDYRDATAVDNLLGAHRNYETQLANRREMFTPQPLNAVGAIGKDVNKVNDPLANLKQEALKYKSVDEFVKSQGTPIYHGTNADFDITKAMSGYSNHFGKGTYFATDKANAQGYADFAKVTKGGDAIVHEAVLPSNTKVLDLSSNEGKDIVRNLGFNPEQVYSKNGDLKSESLARTLELNGYEGIKANGGEEVVVFNPTKLQTRQQLTDLYNQAHAESTPAVAPRTKLVSQSQPTAAPAKPRTKLVSGTSLPDDTPAVTQNSLTRKAELQNLSPEVAAQVSGEGVVRNTQKLADDAVSATQNLATKDLVNQANERIAVKLGSIGDDDVAFIQQAIERADFDGNTAEAVALHDGLSEHLRKKGQDIQAASLLYRLSPNGIFFKARKDLKEALPKGKFTPEMEKELKRLTQDIKAAKTPEDKAWAQALLQKYTADNLPRKTSQDILSVWKAGLLSGVKTQGGNLLSNATFAGLKAASNPLAASVDKALSLATKERTNTATMKGFASGIGEGTKKGFKTLRTGVDERNMTGDKYETFGELNFKNKAIQKVVGDPTNLVFRGMSSADQPFYFGALRNSLYDQAKAAGLTKGLKGKELRSFMETTAKNPPMNIAEKAGQEAWKAVLGQDNKLASKISSITREYPAAGVLVPFVKVPTNFLIRTLDYTPAGAVKQAVKSIKSNKAGEGIQQRELSQAIAEATTGSALVYLGAELANSGLLSGQYPKDHPKEAQRWKAEGITPNSVKVGDKWLSLNYLGPAGLLFGAGKDFVDANKQGENGAVAATAGVGKNLTGQSFLSGFSGFSNAISDPQREAKSFVNSQAASVVPAWANDIANLKDKNQRQADTVAESVKNRIPLARESNKVKQDVYGNELSQAAGRPNTLNPLKPSNDMSDKSVAVAEVNRLHNVDVNNKDLQVTPTAVNKKLDVEGKQIKLTNDQRYALQKKIGQTTQSNWNKLIQTPEYQSLTDIEKAEALDRLRKGSVELAQRDYVTSNNLGKYTKNATQAAVRAAQGDIASFAKTPKQLAQEKSAAKKIAKTKSKSTKVAKGRKASSGSRKGTGSSKVANGFAKINSTNKAADSALRDLVKKDRISGRKATVAKASNVQLKKNKVTASKVSQRSKA